MSKRHHSIAETHPGALLREVVLPELKESKTAIAKALGISLATAYDRIQQLFGHGCLRKSETEEYGRNIALTEKGISLCESFNDNRRTPTNS